MIKYPIVSILFGISVTYCLATITAAAISHLGFPLPPAKKRIGCVDGLRGYLAISVFICHFIVWMQVSRFGCGWEHPSVNFFDALGTGGVALFFMTTGLVFYPRVLIGYRSSSWVSIYTSRIFRLVPLIVISVVVITSIIVLRTGNGFDISFPKAAAEWITTWGQPPLLGYPDSGRLNAYVLWSLWYEWLFYIFVLPVCALAMDLIRDRLPSYILPAMLLVASLAARALVPRSLLIYLPLFSIGMLAYEITTYHGITSRLRTNVAAIIAVVGILSGMVMFPNPYGLALPMYGFFFVCVASGNRFGGVLQTIGALVLGECSYSIYILHGILLNILFVDLITPIKLVATSELPIILLPLATIIISVIAPISFLFVERPAIRAGSQIARYLAGRRSR